jgi:hypothetical protein
MSSKSSKKLASWSEIIVLGTPSLKNKLAVTSAGLGCSPNWEAPSSLGFPTRTANPRLKGRP